MIYSFVFLFIQLDVGLCESVSVLDGRLLVRENHPCTLPFDFAEHDQVQWHALHLQKSCQKHRPGL